MKNILQIGIFSIIFIGIALVLSSDSVRGKLTGLFGSEESEINNIYTEVDDVDTQLKEVEKSKLSDDSTDEVTIIDGNDTNKTSEPVAVVKTTNVNTVYELLKKSNAEQCRSSWMTFEDQDYESAAQCTAHIECMSPLFLEMLKKLSSENLLSVEIHLKNNGWKESFDILSKGSENDGEIFALGLGLAAKCYEEILSPNQISLVDINVNDYPEISGLYMDYVTAMMKMDEGCSSISDCNTKAICMKEEFLAVEDYASEKELLNLRKEMIQAVYFDSDNTDVVGELSDAYPEWFDLLVEKTLECSE